MKWRLYYDGGDTFSDQDGEPWESPPWGVICIAQQSKDYPEILGSGVAWYLYRDDVQAWFECDEGGFLDQVSHYARYISAVRFGRYTQKRLFTTTMAVARQWLNNG